MSKYGNKKIKVEGMTFDSLKEYRRYRVLKEREKEGLIRDLQRQVKFVLIPSQKDGSGVLLERECSYVADFVYKEDRRTVVEDVKSPITRKEATYILKRKLMLHVHGIRIREI